MFFNRNEAILEISRKIFGLIGSSVKDDGQVQNPTPNIAVDLFDSDSKLIGEATTDGEGYYEFLMLDDGKYTVIPKPNGYVFDPTQAIVDIIGVD